MGIYAIAIFSAVIGGVALLPDTTEYPLPTAITTAITLIYGYGVAWDEIFPISTLIYIATLVASIELIVLLWKTVRWAISIARGSRA